MRREFIQDVQGAISKLWHQVNPYHPPGESAPFDVSRKTIAQRTLRFVSRASKHATGLGGPPIARPLLRFSLRLRSFGHEEVPREHELAGESDIELAKHRADNW